MSKKKLIPFSWWPGHWGLTGKIRELARIDYELSGEERERAHAELVEDPVQREKKSLQIDLDYRKITPAQYEKKTIELMYDNVDKQLALLDWKRKYEKMPDQQYDKEYHTLKKLPWVCVVKMDFVAKEGSFELDWNEHFIESLRNAGYKGSDHEIINVWFMEVCRNVALETFDGVGTFTEDSGDNLDRAIDSVRESK